MHSLAQTFLGEIINPFQLFNRNGILFCTFALPNFLLLQNTTNYQYRKNKVAQLVYFLSKRYKLKGIF
jgi:hypothetical protein